MKNGEVPGREEAVYKTWWKNRSKLARWLIIAAIISTVLLVLILLVYLLLPNEPLVCTSSSCARISKELLLNYVDLRVDPCEDFYRFSCGNFLQNTNLANHGSRSARRLMEDEIRARIKNMLEEPLDGDPAFNLAKKFYRACTNKTAIDIEGLKGIEEIFERIGGWPVLNGNNWREDKFDWKDAVYKLRQAGINFEFFLILSVQRDKADPGRYVLNMKDPFFSKSTEISEEIKKLYLDYMVDLAVLMGADEKAARKQQEEVLELLLKLAEIQISAEAGKETRDYNLYSLSELQTEFPDIHWHEFIPRIFQPIPFSYDYEINVPKPSYIKNLLKLLKQTKKRIVANFICWHILQRLINYLPDKISNVAYEYLVKLDSNATRTPRWHTCLDETEIRLSTVISAAYVKKYLDEETRHGVISLIRNIKYRFKENLDELDWLDAKTKDIARAILVSSVEDIPSYNNLIEGDRFYEEIKNVNISEDKLLAAVLNLDYVATNIRYEMLRQPVSENFFQNPGFVTGLNIVYSPKENVLRIPVGLFQGIFYQKSRPEYMNYGALGTVIAHEIYHIMTEAKYKNSQNKLTSRWSPQSLLNYEQKLQCLSSRYGKYVVSNIEQHENSTRDEDMADLAGIKVAYGAYERWVRGHGLEAQLPELHYSPKQLFWVSAAIHHCTKHPEFNSRSPERARINGALQDLDEFALDFGCPAGAQMNPEHKCRIW